MKFSLALLLSTATLLAAIPTSADSFGSGSVRVSVRNQLIASPRTDFESDSSKNETSRAELFLVRVERGFPAIEVVVDSDLASHKALGAFSSALLRPEDVDARNSAKPGSYRGGTGEVLTEGRQPDDSTTLVPEPPSLSLFVFGLAAMASIALRRR